jgi:hypothetical protein
MHSFRLYILFYASRKALGIVAFLTLAGLVGNNLLI